LEEAEPNSPSSDDENNSDYAESIDLEKTKNESDDEDDEDNNDGGNGDLGMKEGGSRTRRMDENYEEFDASDEEMEVEHYGRASYSGGLGDDKWKAWQ
jgi:hypothetical protein